jgi:hypothetical protein
MVNYQFYVDDLRYSVPTLCFNDAHDDAKATSLAVMMLAENQNYVGVEVRRGDERVRAAAPTCKGAEGLMMTI